MESTDIQHFGIDPDRAESANIAPRGLTPHETEFVSRMYYDTIGHAYAVTTTEPHGQTEKRTQIIYQSKDGKKLGASWKEKTGGKNGNNTLTLTVNEFGDKPRVITFSKLLNSKNNLWTVKYWDLAISNEPTSIVTRKLIDEVKAGEIDSEGTLEYKRQEEKFAETKEKIKVGSALSFDIPAKNPTFE